MRQLAGQKTTYHWAHATPLAGRIAGSAEISSREGGPEALF